MLVFSDEHEDGDEPITTMRKRSHRGRQPATVVRPSLAAEQSADRHEAGRVPRDLRHHGEHRRGDDVDMSFAARS